jgi:uncharacterized protein (DUF3084 family)
MPMMGSPAMPEEDLQVTMIDMFGELLDALKEPTLAKVTKQIEELRALRGEVAKAVKELDAAKAEHAANVDQLKKSATELDQKANNLAAREDRLASAERDLAAREDALNKRDLALQRALASTESALRAASA